MLNEDYRDILRALSEESASFLLVGAYAMAVHGYPRATMDIDLWILPSPDNADAVLRALVRFGAPIGELAREDLMQEGIVFQIGLAPRRIDLLTSVTGLHFDAAYARAQTVNIDGIDVQVIAREDLIINKRATGRTRDLADAEVLEELTGEE